MANDDKIEIRYVMPKFHRRVFANLLDIILLAFVFFGLFMGARSIVTNSGAYKSKENELASMMSESGLYYVNQANNEYVDIVSYYQDESRDFTGSQKKNGAVSAINKFFAYSKEKASETDYKVIIDSYDTYRLSSSLAYEGASYFVESDGAIIENPDCKANDLAYFSNAYSPYIDNYLQGYLITKIPGYLELSRYEAIMLIFAEAVPSYLVAGLLVYLLPPLIMHRNRYTVGKALYRIGLADPNLLSVSLKRFSLRFLIFYFLEYVLSIVTFGIPFLVSFSLMAFSKKKQGLPDYMTGCNEVDLSNNKLYKSYAEIRLSKVNNVGKAVDFESVSGLDDEKK